MLLEEEEEEEILLHHFIFVKYYFNAGKFRTSLHTTKHLTVIRFLYQLEILFTNLRKIHDVFQIFNISTIIVENPHSTFLLYFTSLLQATVTPTLNNTSK